MKRPPLEAFRRLVEVALTVDDLDRCEAEAIADIAEWIESLEHPPTPAHFCSIEEAAELLGITRTGVYNLLARGQLEGGTTFSTIEKKCVTLASVKARLGVI